MRIGALYVTEFRWMKGPFDKKQTNLKIIVEVKARGRQIGRPSQQLGERKK